MPRKSASAPKKSVTRKRVTGHGAYHASAAPARRAPARRRAAPRGTSDYQPSLGRTLLSEGGGMLGGLFGLPGVGKAAGNALSTVLGLGDYEIKKNVFLEGRLPEVYNQPSGGGTVIRFQEYLTDVYTTANVAAPDAFNIQSYLINPANPGCFPWLAQVASNYEQYSLEGMIFEFRSTSANALNSTNTALGSVMLATQYDVADPVFVSKAEMLNYEYSNSVKPSENCMHMIECAPRQSVLSELYTLRGTAPANTDSRLYHLGRFSIATVGFQAANVNIGELHVTYQVRLLKPKLFDALGNALDFALLTNSNYSNTFPWNQTDATWGFNPSTNFAISMASGTLTFPPSSVIKTYRIECYWVGVTLAAITFPSPTVANGTLANSTSYAPGSGESATKALMSIVITTLGNSKSCSVSMPSCVLPASGNLSLIRVIQVPQNVIV